VTSSTTPTRPTWSKCSAAGRSANELVLTADDFSRAPREKVEEAGGAAELTELGEERQAEPEDGNEADEDEA